MIDRQLGKVVRYIRRVASGPDGTELTDGQLVRRFVDSRDEAAFALLVEKHGPMVLSVCRRILHDPHAAEDAFQAAFLVLARKASSIRKQESVGSWLYGVAYRVASKARGKAAVLRRRETVLNEGLSVQEKPETAWGELRPALDEELGRLPEKYRTPMILCYLEGKTNEQAARELGWTKGTVSGRLARARDLLRKRLERRGLALTPALLATLLCEQAAPAAVGGPLLVSAVKVACGTPGAMALVGTGKAITLAEGVMNTMFLTKMKITAGILLTLTVAVAGVAVMGYAGADRDAPQPIYVSAGQPAANKPASDQELLQGTWKPVAAERGGLEIMDKLAELKITFEGNKVHFELLQGGKQGTYKLDPDKSPKHIDLIPPEGKVGVGLGIYKLEAGKLHLCIQDDSNKGRPTVFASPAESSHSYVVLVAVGGKAAQGKNAQAALQLQQLRAENETLKAELAKLRADMAKVADILKAKNQFPADQTIQTALNLLKAAQQKPDDQKPEVGKLKEAADRTRSANNLKQIGIAFHNYHDAHKKFPADAIYSKDGKPLLSWRVAILPYLEQDALYRQFKLDEPWDSPHNLKLLDTIPVQYVPARNPPKEKNVTFYQVFTGPGTLFDGPKGKGFQDILDGTSNTVLVVEGGKAVPWTKPEDLPFEAGKPLPKLGGMFDGGFNLLWADGAVRFVPPNYNEKALRQMITIADGQVVEELVPPKKEEGK